LSRAIKELEETLGITLFRRTSKGIVPTANGEEFLLYAKSVLAEVDKIESLFKRDGKERLVFSISIPRASYITHAYTKFVAEVDMKKQIEFSFHETNSINAINNILHNGFNLGIIRYQSIHENYFSAMLKEKDLKSEEIWEFEYLALMSVKNPLADKESIFYQDLSEFIEIAHGDPYVPSLPIAEVKKSEFSDLINKRIFVYERGSQFDLLCDIPHTYMWVSSIPKVLLERYRLVQRVCKDADKKYKDVLIYRNNYKVLYVYYFIFFLYFSFT
jgi:DNA-binding transcriptional LysR family regulator